MDLLSIVRTVWRYRLATIPVILLTVVGVLYVVAIKPPVYEASSEFMLLPAPGVPTAAQIKADPKLRYKNSNNPYTNIEDLPVVADAVLSVLTSDASQQALLKAGADPQYQVALSADASTPPILQITGIAPTPQEAIRSANLVTDAASTDLYQMQKNQGVDDYYMIKGTDLVRADRAALSVSGKLRTLVAVLALGAVLLFVVISVVDAMDKRRKLGSTDADMPARTPVDVPRQPAPRNMSSQMRQL